MIFKTASEKRDSELFRRILEIPEKFRCFQAQAGKWRNLPENYILLGVRESKASGWSLFSEVKKDPSGFNFYLGATHPEIFEAYVRSSFPSKARELFVGSSTDSGDSDFSGKLSSLDIFDYSSITEILSQGWYPELKSLSLGTTELLCNGPGLNGSVGDVTELLKKMPNLESLEIGGYFALSEPVFLPRLKKLDIDVVSNTETLSSKEPTAETFRELFVSEFPLLEEIFIYLDCEGSFKRQTNYLFPEKFLEGKSTPNLKELEISGLFGKGETQQLFESRVWQRCQRKISAISEAYYLAVSIHNEGDTAFVCGVTFTDLAQSEPDCVYHTKVEISGESYRKGYSCVTKLIEEHQLLPAVVVTYECSYKRIGADLSGFFYEECKEVVVIDVDKNPGEDAPEESLVFRGGSSEPLNLKGAGLDSEFSKTIISGMAGEHRVPELLELVDRLCREEAVNQRQ